MSYLLTFLAQKETFSVLVKGKEIFYSDRKLIKPTRLVPVNPDLKRQVLMSRNKISAQILKQFELTKEEQKEYDGATSEEELVKICIKDAITNGSSLLSQTKMENKDG